METLVPGTFSFNAVPLCSESRGHAVGAMQEPHMGFIGESAPSCQVHFSTWKSSRIDRRDVTVPPAL